MGMKFGSKISQFYNYFVCFTPTHLSWDFLGCDCSIFQAMRARIFVTWRKRRKIEGTDWLMRSSNESQDLCHVTYKPYWLVVALSNQSLGNDILTSHDLIIWILATFGENPPLVVHIFHKNDNFSLIILILKVSVVHNCRGC